MSEAKRFLAFDLGAESGRAVVGEILDDRLTLNEIHRFPTGGSRLNGHYHWNIIGFYSNFLEGLKKYVERFGTELDGIGVDTWGVDFGLLDGNGNLIGFPYTYRDDRTNGMDLLIGQKLGAARLYELTGIQMLPFNTVNQLVSMVEANDPALNSAQSILFIGDLLHYFLTGRKTTEYTAVSISQLYNASKKDWESEVFHTLGIPERIMTEVIHAGDLVAALRQDISQEFGLGPVPVIAPAVHDTASAAVAVPSTDGEGWAFLSSGTWSIVGLELDQPVVNQESYALNISNSGGAFGKNLYLKNVAGLWIIQCCKRIWNKRNPNLTYPQIEDLASTVDPFRGIIDPDHPSFLNPVDATVAVAKFIEETGQVGVDPDDIGTISRIVFESLALKYRNVLEKLMAATGRKVEVVHVMGGGSKNTLLNRFTANSLGMKVTAGPVEATAIGNVMMQAKGTGLYGSLSEIRRVVAKSFEIVEYLPQEKEMWDKAYCQFLKFIC